MGLLDDAIREHLELKRRRGADLDEVARQEDEALGDPRRAETAPEAPEGTETPEEPAAEAAAATPDEPAGETWLEDDDPIASVASQRTAEFTPPEAEPAAAAPLEARPEEDVLEETPEFLQETPEHERLWFEQKPPRDFDFDS